MTTIPTPAEVLTPWIDKARQVIASTDSLNEAIGTLILDVMQSDKGDIIATLALLQLAADEDSAGITR